MKQPAKLNTSPATTSKTTNDPKQQSDAKQQSTGGDSLSDSFLQVILERLIDMFGPMLEKQTEIMLEKQTEIIKKVVDCQGDIQKLSAEVKETA